MSHYGAVFIDEINRGKGQEEEIFGILDGYLTEGGEKHYLRIPIPNQKGMYKGLTIIAAMNPADAEHSSALDLDIAGENRFLKFKFPNGVVEAGSSQLGKNMPENLYKQFWTEFGKRSGVNEGWKKVYPVVTDPKQFSHNLDGQTREFIDIALGYVGYDPKETYTRNLKLLKQGGVNPNFSIREDNKYQNLLSAQGNLKHSFVRRDLRKIRDLSRLISFIRGIKDESYDTAVKLNDVAVGIGVILESKTITGTDPGSLIGFVNDARSTYVNMHNQLGIPEGYGLRETIFQTAVQTGQEHGFGEYLNVLQCSTKSLNKQAADVSQVVMKSRLVADLVVLEHFSKSYEADITSALKERGNDALSAFQDVYKSIRTENRPSVYSHRLESIITPCWDYKLNQDGKVINY